MRPLLFRLAAACLMAAPSMAAAQTAARPVVLELFVSQGCAACPQANAALAELSSTRDVLPLTYDVDYWDYLGWKDTLAHPDFSARQRAYADRFGNARIYTPQMVVDGREQGPGADRPRIEGEIKSCREEAESAPHLMARREGMVIAIEIAEGPAPDGGADVWLVAYQPGHITTEVTAGENAGRSFTVVNPVRKVDHVGRWRGGAEHWRVSAPDSEAFAVLVQRTGAGPVLAAASGH